MQACTHLVEKAQDRAAADTCTCSVSYETASKNCSICMHVQLHVFWMDYVIH